MNEQTFHNILMSADFADWYNTHFQDYVEGDEGAPSQANILNTLKQFIEAHTIKY